jgi:hypothetical protein
MNKKILILGIDSLIGKSLGVAAESAGYQVVATSRQENTHHTYLEALTSLKGGQRRHKCVQMVKMGGREQILFIYRQ